MRFPRRDVYSTCAAVLGCATLVQTRIRRGEGVIMGGPGGISAFLDVEFWCDLHIYWETVEEDSRGTYIR
jgi:hypothetical protein